MNSIKERNMRRNFGGSGGFTIIELMVSIFITVIVTASFYKLYVMATRSERSSSIRVSVNLLGEQMLDTISESVRFIGLNSDLNDFKNYNDETNTNTSGILRQTSQYTFKYLSPYSGPVTKLKQPAGGTYPKCSFTIYNSAAFNNKITSFFLHNQDGIYETKQMPIGGGYDVSYGDYTATFNLESDDAFIREPKSGISGECKDIFPAGTLISGTDRLFTLKYDNSSGSIYLYSQDLRVPAGDDATDKVDLINFTPNYGAAQTYRMPVFRMQYLTETPAGTDGFERQWRKSVDWSLRKNIIAVRFGFIMLSQRDRNKVSLPNTVKNTYCIFGDGDNDDCLPVDAKYTAYVFKREIYLSNHRLLKDSANQ